MNKSLFLPEYNQIPNVGLYLEQIAKLINSSFENYPSLLITPSMISNYAKKKLIERATKKQYTQDQIATLYFIALCKNVISIENIAQFLKENRLDTKELYENFRTSLLFHLSQSIPSSKKTSDTLDHLALAVTYHIVLLNDFQKEKKD
ncbi:MULTISPECIES: DUF1836 domain-containing protein [Terrabacteria group]|uniref:DUF1836 domain-containing protein n=1 Tax=Bacillati TaxID=1783272 RepID=UPI001939CD6B|nr:MULTISPECIES: DUF1836 domain-containing protein [Terrabacteria group]MBW9212065.1 DUF1836 domain-containing protein [Trueperella sp. zg.1013]QRG87129.1 DUF1836 domain-containing protein [Bulleidia sp. zg-1006]